MKTGIFNRELLIMALTFGLCSCSGSGDSSSAKIYSLELYSHTKSEVVYQVSFESVSTLHYAIYQDAPESWSTKDLSSENSPVQITFANLDPDTEYSVSVYGVHNSTHTDTLSTKFNISEL